MSGPLAGQTIDVENEVVIGREDTDLTIDDVELSRRHAVVRRHKERLRRWIRLRARDAGAGDPETLSRRLMVVFAGGQAQALVLRSVQPATDARAVARVLVDASVAD